MTPGIAPVKPVNDSSPSRAESKQRDLAAIKDRKSHIMLF